VCWRPTTCNPFSVGYKDFVANGIFLLMLEEKQNIAMVLLCIMWFGRAGLLQWPGQKIWPEPPIPCFLLLCDILPNLLFPSSSHTSSLMFFHSLSCLKPFGLCLSFLKWVHTSLFCCKSVQMFIFSSTLSFYIHPEMSWNLSYTLRSTQPQLMKGRINIMAVCGYDPNLHCPTPLHEWTNFLIWVLFRLWSP
jgi:hypothetical protein